MRGSANTKTLERACHQDGVKSDTRALEAATAVQEQFENVCESRNTEGIQCTKLIGRT